MPDRQLRNLTSPYTAAGAQSPLQWRAASELGQWLLSVRNNVSRRIGNLPAYVTRSAERSQRRERPSPRPDMFCP
jgi:hypothetical protein